MIDDGPVHLDEDGRPCARHEPAQPDRMRWLAFVGMRAPGFNHDFATHLQSLLMSVEALSTMVTKRGDAELLGMVRELSGVGRRLEALLEANRALVRPASRTRESLRDVIRQVTECSNIVLLCELPDVELSVSAPVAIHALTLAFLVAAAVRPGSGAELGASCLLLPRHVELVLAAVAPAPELAAESLAVAAEMLVRDGGDLRCGDGRLVIRLPLS